MGAVAQSQVYNASRHCHRNFKSPSKKMAKPDLQWYPLKILLWRLSGGRRVSGGVFNQVSGRGGMRSFRPRHQLFLTF